MFNVLENHKDAAQRRYSYCCVAEKYHFIRYFFVFFILLASSVTILSVSCYAKTEVFINGETKNLNEVLQWHQLCEKTINFNYKRQQFESTEEYYQRLAKYRSDKNKHIRSECDKFIGKEIILKKWGIEVEYSVTTNILIFRNVIIENPVLKILSTQSSYCGPKSVHATWVDKEYFGIDEERVYLVGSDLHFHGIKGNAAKKISAHAASLSIHFSGTIKSITQDQIGLYEPSFSTCKDPKYNHYIYNRFTEDRIVSFRYDICY